MTRFWPSRLLPSHEKLPLLHGITLAAIVLYVLTQFNPHTNALRNLGVYGATFAGVIGLLTSAAPAKTIKELRWLHYLVVAFFLWTVLSSALGEQPDYSLMSLRKSLGTQLIFALVVWYAVREAWQAALLYYAFVLALAIMLGVDIVQYASEFAAREAVVDILDLHYWYATPLSMMISYSVPLILARARWTRIIGATMLVISVALLIDADSRAGWAAGFLGISVTSLLLKSRRALILGSVIFVAIVAGAVAVQSAKMADRLAKPASDSQRPECCWGPYFALGMDKPVLGHGFGRDIQRQAYADLVAKHPGIAPDRYIGPHNSYIDVFFYFGAGGLALFIIMVACAISVSLRAYGQALDESWRTLLAPTAGTLVGTYAFAAMFQVIDYRFLGVLLGICLASTRVGSMERRRVAV